MGLNASPWAWARRSSPVSQRRRTACSPVSGVDHSDRLADRRSRGTSDTGLRLVLGAGPDPQATPGRAVPAPVADELVVHIDPSLLDETTRGSRHPGPAP